MRPANWPKHGFGAWLIRAAQRLHPNVLAAALANKLARISVPRAVRRYRVMHRAPASNLLVYKGIAHVIDAGYGTAFKLIDAGLPITAVRRVFITHHHSDHNIDLGPMLISAWATGLGTSVDVYGPAGLTALINSYWESNRFDIETRIADDGRVDLRKLVTAHEYSQGVVLDTPDVKVTALRNMHPPIIESFALKFEFGGKTVVFSGDTTYFPPLAEFARGADYLILEVMNGPALRRS